jgi:hypothetical protein
MKSKTWYLIWGGLYALCAALGFVPVTEEFPEILLMIPAGLFFVPGWALLVRSYRQKDPTHAKAVAAVSLCSLTATLIFLVLNFLSGHLGQAAGNFLYSLLVVFSVPMVCARYWIASLFLWACLLMTGLSLAKKRK